MEAEKLKDKLTTQNHETKTFVGTKDLEEEAISQSSSSTKDNIDSPSKIKQNSPLKTKKKKIVKKPLSHKSKAKKVVSDNPRQTKSCKRKRIRIDDLYENIEAKFSVMDRAGGMLVNLAAESPTFVKCMLPSNVTHGFWLFLPKKFCDLYLPSHDTTVILVDEFGNEYKTKYLLERNGLSGGWRAFSIAHRLLKGDLLIFHLVGPCKLKVSIVRVYGLDEVDAALCLVNLDSYAKGTRPGPAKKGDKTGKKGKKGVEPLPLDVLQPNDQNQNKSRRISNSNLGLVADQSENNSDSFGSEDSEISNHLQGNELCSRQNSFSHDNPLDGVDYT